MILDDPRFASFNVSISRLYVIYLSFSKEHGVINMEETSFLNYKYLYQINWVKFEGFCLAPIVTVLQSSSDAPQKIHAMKTVADVVQNITNSISNVYQDFPS